MLFTYFKEIPKRHPRSRAHGRRHHRPRADLRADADGDPGPRLDLLLNLILAWNEAFWTLNLSTSDAAPLTVFIASYSSPEGLFWAKLSAASTLAIAPDPRPRLVQPAAARPRPHLRRRQSSEGLPDHGPDHASGTCRKSFGPVQHHQGRRSRDRGRLLRGVRRPVGLRQDHAAAPDRRARGRHRRQDPDRRRERGRRAAGQARPVDGVPVLRALSAYERARQHRASA